MKWPRYERGTGWDLPKWLRRVLWPLAVVGLVLLLVGEAVMAAIWVAKKLRGK